MINKNFCQRILFLLFLLGASYAPLLGNEQSITELTSQVNATRTALNGLQQMLKPCQEIRLEHFRVYKTLAKIYETHSKRLNQLKAEVRRLKIKSAKLVAPYDLTVAWKKYRDAGKSKEAFKELYQTVRGQKPSNSTLQTRGIEEILIEREIRVKVAIPLGLALVQIGNILIEFNQLAGRGVPGMIHPRNAWKAATTFARRAELNMKITQLAHKYGGAAGKFVFKNIIGLKHSGTMISEFSKVFSAGRVIPKSTLNYLSSFKSKKIERAIQFLPIIGASLVKSRVKEMAKDLFRQSKLQMYGTEDRAASKRKIDALLRNTETSIQQEQQEVTRGATAVKEYELLIKEMDTKLDKIKASLINAELDLKTSRAKIIDQTLIEKEKEMKKEIAKLGGGNPSPSSIKIGAESHILAGDDCSAYNLDMPRSTKVWIQGNLAIPQVTRITYPITGKDKKTIQVTALKKWIQQVGDFTTCNGVSFKCQGPIGTKGKQAEIMGNGIGKATFSASIRGITQQKIISRTHYNDVIPIYGSLHTKKVKVEVRAIKDLELKAGDTVLNSKTKVNLFTNAGSSHISIFQNSIDIKTRMNVSNNTKSWFEIPRHAIEAKIENINIANITNIDQNNDMLSITAGSAIGKTKLTCSLIDGKGNNEFKKRINIACGEISLKTTTPEHYQNILSNTIPPEVPAKVSIIIDGITDMKGYTVEWDVSDKEAKATLKTKSKFQSTSTGSECSCSLTFSTPESNPTAVKGIIRAPDGSKVAEVLSDIIKPAMLITKIDLVYLGNSGSHKIAGRFDLFSPAKPSVWANAKLGVKITTANSGKFIRQLNYFDISLGSTAEQALNLYRGTFDRDANLMNRMNSQDVEESSLQVKLDPMRAILNKWFVKDNTFLDSSFILGFNKLQVYHLTNDGNDILRLQIIGSAPASNFSAHWIATDGQTVNTPMKKDGKYWVSDLRNSKKTFTQVKLMGAGGIEVGYLDFKIHGKPKPKPKLIFQLPSTIPVGRKWLAKAIAKNVPNRDDVDFHCNFRAEPSIVSFSIKSARVFASNGGISQTTISFNGKPREKVKVTATLYQKIGKNQIKLQEVSQEVLLTGTSSKQKVLEPISLPFGDLILEEPSVSTIALERITTTTGNNPFSTSSNPITNSDGSSYNPTSLSPISTPITPGPVTGIPTSGSVPGIVGSKEFGTFYTPGGGEYFFAGINVDANTGSGFFRNDGAGQFLIFQTPENGPMSHTGRVEFFPDWGWNNGGQNAWDFDSDKTSGPPNPNVLTTLGTPTTIYMKATTGMKIKMTFHITMNSTKSPNQRVSSDYILNVTEATFYK